jgi:hypothetical protein
MALGKIFNTVKKEVLHMKPTVLSKTTTVHCEFLIVLYVKPTQFWEKAVLYTKP